MEESTNTDEVVWILDSSTFIHALTIDRVAILVHLRHPVYFPEYVFRFELGSAAKEITREAASTEVLRNRVGIQKLTLADLDRIASLGAPRKIGLGELACAVIAERILGGVLCDDRKAKAWIESHLVPRYWHSIEDVLLHAAGDGCIGELDLFDSQRTLERNQYHCREDLRMAHLQRMLTLRSTELPEN